MMNTYEKPTIIEISYGDYVRLVYLDTAEPPVRRPKSDGGKMVVQNRQALHNYDYARRQRK